MRRSSSSGSASISCALGVWDYAATGQVSTYTMFIVALLAYGLIWGKRDLRRLDAWMARKVRRQAQPG